MLLAQTTVFARKSSESLYLVKRFASKVTLDPIQEAALSVSNIRDAAVDKAEMKVVLRLCTTEEMKPALVKSAWLYPTIIKTFVGYGFEKKDIIVLKSGDCLSSANVSATPTEIWVSNQSKLLPPYSEKYSAAQIKVTEIGSSNYYTGNPDYLAHTEEMISSLKCNASEFGVVLGFYIKPSAKKLIRNKINRVISIIKKNGFPPSRYNTEIIKTTDWLAAGEPKYPLFYTVSIRQP